MVPMWMFPLALACGNSFVLATGAGPDGRGTPG
jgi:acyl-CoA reductase-like NAD-dependent aldehyde dehydrogenase